MFLPLGEDCVTAEALRDIQIRNCSYPFDWISGNVKTRINILLKVLKMDHDQMRLFLDDFFNVETHTTYVQNYDKKIVFCNTTYNVAFPHNDIKTIKETYIRRFSRLINDYKDADIVNIVCVSFYKTYNEDILYLLENTPYKVRVFTVNSVTRDMTHERLYSSRVNVPPNCITIHKAGNCTYHQTTFRSHVKDCLSNVFSRFISE